MFYCNDYIALPFFYVSYFSSNSSDLCRIPYFVTQRILMMPSILRGIKIERESVNLDRPLELDILIRNERRPTVELIHQTRVFFLNQSVLFCSTILVHLANIMWCVIRHYRLQDGMIWSLTRRQKQFSLIHACTFIWTERPTMQMIGLTKFMQIELFASRSYTPITFDGIASHSTTAINRITNRHQDNMAS